MGSKALLLLWVSSSWALDVREAESLVRGVDAWRADGAHRAVLTVTTSTSSGQDVWRLDMRCTGPEVCEAKVRWPPRSRNNAMLREGDTLWRYVAALNDVQVMADAELQLPMEGAAVTWDHLFGPRPRIDRFTVQRDGRARVGERDAWRLKLVARSGEHNTRLLYVDKLTGRPLREVALDEEERPLRTLEWAEVSREQNTVLPKRWVLTDHVRGDLQTEVVWEDLQLTSDAQPPLKRPRWWLRWDKATP